MCVYERTRSLTPHHTIQTDGFLCYLLSSSASNAIQFVIFVIIVFEEEKKTEHIIARCGPLDCVRSGVLDMCIHNRRESQLKSQGKKHRPQLRHESEKERKIIFKIIACIAI